MMHNKPKKLNKGYAILFAVVFVSIITLITLGLSNTSYKQLILSSLADNSTQAFYQSDTATECVLYADNIVGMKPGAPSSWNCGVDASGNNLSFAIGTGTGSDDYNAVPTIENPIGSTNPPASTSPCFDFNAVKDNTGTTTFYARGYSSCDLNNPKTVQREIKITYQP